MTAIRALREQGFQARVLVLTTYDTDSDVLPAIKAGATGYLLKDTPREELFRAGGGLCQRPARWLIGAAGKDPGSRLEYHRGMDWGNVPAWVGSLLTGFSLTIAAISYVRNSQERRKENAERAREQAALVSCWAVNPRRWVVKNGNGVAVSVRVVVDAETWSAPVVFFPGETRGLRVPSDVEIGTLFLPQEIVDSFGRRWERLGSGELRETGGVAVSSRPAARLIWEERT